MRKYYGRSHKGERAICVVPTMRSLNKTIMGTIGRNNFFHYLAIQGNGNCISLTHYFQQLFDRFNIENIRNAWIILDNASFYKNRNFMEMVHNFGHQLLYLPPYSPFFNPIENVFS